MPERFSHSDLRFQPYSGEKLPDYFEYEAADKDLAEFYNEDAEKYQNESITKVINVFYGDRLVAYYAYTSSEIRKSELRVDDKVAPFPHPAIKLGRLLVCNTQRHRGIGRTIIEDIVSRALEARRVMPLRFLIVDSKPNSIGFYTKLGFVDPDVKQKHERILKLLYIDLKPYA